MRNTYVFIVLIICLLFLSCNQRQKVEVISTNTKHDNPYLDSLFNEAIKNDSIEYLYLPNQVFYFRSGYILSDTDKNIISISYTNSDSIYKVYLYDIENNKILVKDSLLIGDILQVNLSLEFNDYNFDGQKDFYLQAFVSNGLAISRGYLVFVDPLTKKLTEYKEARNLANIRSDSKSKTIFSDSIVFDHQYGRSLCLIKHQWVNGKLIATDIDYPYE